MFKIAKWFNNYQAPAVLMIDDLSDSYIDVYSDSYKNDWGYLCDKPGSSFHFLKKKLLEAYPHIKITFFVPYLKHGVINENSQYRYKKFSLGEREEYVNFLKKLNKYGHEIAHHGSNHGKYINKNSPSTDNNWLHEWELFNDIDSGVKTTLDGVKRFKNTCDIDIAGGKYCGYKTISNSQAIIDKCNFLYWCDKINFLEKEYREGFFGQNRTVSFPTNFNGNSFVQLSYKSGKRKRDILTKFTKYLQPIYNILSRIKLYSLYKKRYIISIQEHISPSTSAGTVQAPNIITDIESLNKIFKFLKRFSIWYATCKEIGKYIHIRENCKIIEKKDELIVNFNNYKNINDPIISIVSENAFKLKINNQCFSSRKHNNLYVVNLPIENGLNIFKTELIL
jgi:hypothetical protein